MWIYNTAMPESITSKPKSIFLFVGGALRGSDTRQCFQRDNLHSASRTLSTSLPLSLLFHMQRENMTSASAETRPFVKHDWEKELLSPLSHFYFVFFLFFVFCY